MTFKEKAKQISAVLIAKRFIPRKHLREMFLDEELRAEVENNLKAVGLELATHIYTDHVAVKVLREMEEAVFSDDKSGYAASNNGLSNGALALLTIVWAKIILPKRQMQIERRTSDNNGQDSLWFQREPIPTGTDIISLDEKALLADFGEKLGGKSAFGRYLSELVRTDFISRRDGKIYEGPLLDTVIDYSVLAPRIINGALGEMLGITEKGDDTDVSNEAE